MIVTALLLAGLTGCHPAAAPQAQAAETKPATEATKVEVVHPARQSIRRTTEQPGLVEAFEVTPIHAKISGYVRNLQVNIGSKVTKGQVLAELWVPEMVADVEQKKALVDQAQAKQKQAEAMVDVAQAGLASAEAKVAEIQADIKGAEADVARWQSEYARTRQLASERAVTGSVMDEARSKLHAAESARDAIQAKVRSAEAARIEAKAHLEKARSDVVAAASGVEVAQSETRHAEALLAYAKIEAPFDGVITERNVDTGRLTVPGPQGEPLFVVARTDIITVAAFVPEMYATMVEPGHATTIRFQGLGNRTFPGKVTRTSWALDAKAHTLRAEIDLPNPEGRIRPGLYAYASVVVEEHPDVLTLPSTAIIRDGTNTSCVIVANGRASRRAIKVGINDGTITEIVSGLDGGELVVKANAASLVNGQNVAPVVSEGPAKP